MLFLSLFFFTYFLSVLLLRTMHKLQRNITLYYLDMPASYFLFSRETWGYKLETASAITILLLGHIYRISRIINCVLTSEGHKNYRNVKGTFSWNSLGISAIIFPAIIYIKSFLDGYSFLKLYFSMIPYCCKSLSNFLLIEGKWKNLKSQRKTQAACFMDP